MTTRPGRRGYYADFRVGGRRLQKKLGTDFEAAKSILHDLKARAERADFNLLDNNYQISELRRQWLAHCKQTRKPRTTERYAQALAKILPALACVKVLQLTIPAITEYRDSRLREGASPRTINAEVQALGCMLNWAMGPAKLIGCNPIKELKPLPHDNPKDGRPLSPEEMERLFVASPSHWRDIWYALGVTGMRVSELARLEFTGEFLDWDNREIIVPKWLSKNRVERRIPIDDHLFEIIQNQEAWRLNREPGRGRNKRDTAKVQAKFTRDRIFVTTENTQLQRTNLYRTFIRCCEKAEIPTKSYDMEGRLLTHVDLHSLRRTFITDAISNGSDPATVQQLVGHKTLKMTMNVYHKAQRHTKRQAVGRLSYGAGASAPQHLLETPTSAPKPVHFGERLPANSKCKPQATTL
jgi:integrase